MWPEKTQKKLRNIGLLNHWLDIDIDFCYLHIMANIYAKNIRGEKHDQAEEDKPKYYPQFAGIGAEVKPPMQAGLLAKFPEAIAVLGFSGFFSSHWCYHFR